LIVLFPNGYNGLISHPTVETVCSLVKKIKNRSKKYYCLALFRLSNLLTDKCELSNNKTQNINSYIFVLHLSIT
jgi:hypothetical protein